MAVPVLQQVDWPAVGQWLLDAWALVVQRWQISTMVEPWVVALAAAVALGLVAAPIIWPVTRQAATIIHEAGHAVVARVVGRRVLSIKLHTDTSGVMFSAGKPHGVGVLATMVAGYPAPTVLGAALAVSYATGYAGAGLTVYQLVLLITAWLCSNIVGLLCVLAAFGVTGVLWLVGPAWLVSAAVVALAVFYVVAGLRCMVDVLRIHLRAKTAAGDHAVVQDQVATTDASQAAGAVWWLPLPAGFWLMSFFVIGLTCLAVVIEMLW